MNCAAFERRLEQYQAGTLPEMERREAEVHLDHCNSCRGLFEALQSGENQPDQQDLSGAVLSRTTGSACGRCRDLLGELLDGVSEDVESELVRSHLATCAPCSALFQTMSEMAEILPRMRETVPDSLFVPDVMRSTRAFGRDHKGLSRILDFCRMLAERPRFSWEAAYLGTLLVFGLFGTPFSPAYDAGSRLLASLQNRDGLVTQAGTAIRGWHEDLETAVAASVRGREKVSRMTTRAATAAELLIAQGRDCMQESGGYLASTGKTVQAKIADVYHQVKGSKDGAKEPRSKERGKSGSKG
ncbi:MAG: zf-HC2 domain-containing protein [Acidobacteriota bacterium]